MQSVTRLWLVTFKLENWLESTCTCPVYLKSYMCKHLIGLAVQKKLLVIIYALWKNNTAYDINYKNKYTRELEQALPLGLASIEASLADGV